MKLAPKLLAAAILAGLSTSAAAEITIDVIGGSEVSFEGLVQADYYRFDVNVNGLNFEATVSGVANRTPLSLNVLTSAGAPVASGAPVTGTPSVVRIEIPNRLAIGSYIVQVQSPDTTENNYDLTLKVCTTPLPCP